MATWVGSGFVQTVAGAQAVTELTVAATWSVLTASAVQSHIADAAAATQGTYTAPTNLTEPPTKAEVEAQLALIDAELDKIKVDRAANKTTIDAILSALEALELAATS